MDSFDKEVVFCQVFLDGKLHNTMQERRKVYVRKGYRCIKTMGNFKKLNAQNVYFEHIRTIQNVLG